MAQCHMRSQAFRSAFCRHAPSLRAVVCVRAESNGSRSIQQKAEHIVRQFRLPSLAKPAALAAITNLIATLPAHAEAGKIFDFNLTLPIMVTQFLLLMVFLEKTWFTPVGEVLDKRDKALREKLGSVKENSTELENLQKEAEDVISKARAEASQKIQAAKKATENEIQAAADDHKKKLDKELEDALSKMESEQSSAMGNLDEKVEQQVEDVLKRILPEGVTLPKEQQQPLPEPTEEEEYYWVDKVDEGEWEEEEEGQLEGVGAKQ